MLHVVTADQAGTRIDVLVASLAGASRSQATRSARNGDIRLNGTAAKPSALLAEGDVIEFDIPRPAPLVARPEPIDLAVVYEDDDLLVIDKPAGMVTHPAAGARQGTLVNAVLAHVESALPGDALRAGLIHRLDRDTSGLIVVAKRDASLQRLAADMKARRIRREYLGLVCGVPQHPQGTICAPIGRDPRNRLKFAIVEQGKPAITHYALRERFEKHAELIFHLETGRTHQVRVHLAAAGHPLFNDSIYGKRDARVELPGQALHAWRLSFRHPRTGAPMDFEANPPVAYQRARAMLSHDF